MNLDNSYECKLTYAVDSQKLLSRVNGLLYLDRKAKRLRWHPQHETEQAKKIIVDIESIDKYQSGKNDKNLDELLYLELKNSDRVVFSFSGGKIL